MYCEQFVYQLGNIRCVFPCDVQPDINGENAARGFYVLQNQIIGIESLGSFVCIFCSVERDLSKIDADLRQALRRLFCQGDRICDDIRRKPDLMERAVLF